MTKDTLLSVSKFKNSDYQAVIGLEIHIQLQTDSKIFASDPVRFGVKPNTLISPISLGHPGTLPKLNKNAVNFAIRMGLALGSRINSHQYFDRKNYFYPDLPKGYQITQDKTPICLGGGIDLRLKEGTKRLEFHHIHLEEDAGKSIHEGDNPHSFIDYNRAGTALIEMVTEPCIHSAEEAAGLVSEIRKLARYLGISDGNMEEGSLRADVNISIRKKGTDTLGTKVEIKNMNSIRNIQRAIEFECDRQLETLEAGGSLVQETRTYDAAKNKTFSMRVKETMNDYRYFPEPDLAPLEITEFWLNTIKESMPILPWEQEVLLKKEYQLNDYDAELIADSKELSEYFIAVAETAKNYKSIANWLLGPIKSYLNENQASIEEFPIKPTILAKLINLVENGLITHNLAAQKLFPLCLENPEKDPALTVEEQGWNKQDDSDELKAIVEEVLTEMDDKVQQYKKGKKGLLGLFVGQIMKKTQGTADPKMVNAIVLEKLETI